MSEEHEESEEAPLSTRVGGFVTDLLEELQAEEDPAERLNALKEFMQGYLQVSQVLGLPALCYALMPAEPGFQNVLCGHSLQDVADWQPLHEDLTSRLHEAHSKEPK